MVSRRVLGLAAVTSVLFGGTFVAAKAGLAYIPPFLFVALRFDIAAVALAAVVAWRYDWTAIRPRTRGDWLGILATGGLAIGLANALLFAGQQHATSAVGAIVFGLNPILTPVFAALLLSDERLSARGAVGMALGLVGVALVVDPDPATILSGGLGKLLIFAGAASGALGTVLLRRAETTLSSTVRTAWGLPVAAALTHGMSLAAGESAASAVWSPTAVVALAYVGLLAGAVAYMTYFGLIDATGAIQANLVFYVVPIVATLGGWILLGETISVLTVAGFLTVFAGFAVIGSESIGDWWATVERPTLGGESSEDRPTYTFRSD